jgi:hypothetical protein
VAYRRAWAGDIKFALLLGSPFPFQPSSQLPQPFWGHAVHSINTGRSFQIPAVGYPHHYGCSHSANGSASRHVPSCHIQAYHLGLVRHKCVYGYIPHIDTSSNALGIPPENGEESSFDLRTRRRRLCCHMRYSEKHFCLSGESSGLCRGAAVL